MIQHLPVTAVLPELKRALQQSNSAVLEAPPGAGKTTLVPLALLDEPWAAGKKILMLEPRRIAARAAASRMASLLNEQPGETIGYRVRQDSRVSSRTRVIVLTEALLTRRMQEDPELGDVALVIFDEFHERSLNADLGLALAIDVQGALNDKLKIMVMSATLDGVRISALLGNVPIIKSEGRLFPIETKYAAAAQHTRIEKHVANIIARACHEVEGGILVFLPGEGEIHTVERLLAEENLPGIALMPLYGNMSPEQQDLAIRPRTDTLRKIVLATAIAETSLTIEDIRVVVDCGLQRLARYNPSTGVTQLETGKVSLASADQRRGRSGRVAPGTCYRLWEEAETRALPPYTPAEILTSDLAPFALELAGWGELDTTKLHLLDQPPAGTFAEAQELLRELDAVGTDNRITPHGRACLRFGAHPRLSHMMIKAKEQGLGATAAALAAILGERDVTRTRDTDMRTRIELFAGERDKLANRGALSRAREQARTWSRALGVTDPQLIPSAAGRLIALAYPERIAKRRGPASFRLANGRGAVLSESDPLAAQDYLAIAALDGAGANARVFQAAPLTVNEIEELFGNQIKTRQVVEWNPRERSVSAKEERMLFALVLSERALRNPDPDKLSAALLTGIRSLGLTALPWDPELEIFRARVALLRRLEAQANWPDLGDATLLDSLEVWLAPFITGITRASDFHRVDLRGALEATLDWQQRKKLDAEAPTHLTVPSGSSIRIDYTSAEPVLAVRLQEMFGLADTPSVAGGKIQLTLHLLSPARRPVQVTKDLKSFWKNGYQEVKRDLKGRYPKHHWPEDPWTALPTARAKPRGR
ncbi:MAG: ATP-dependent helicase HrpB [Micropepsaceae bacterium]